MMIKYYAFSVNKQKRGGSAKKSEITKVVRQHIFAMFSDPYTVKIQENMARSLEAVNFHHVATVEQYITAGISLRLRLETKLQCSNRTYIHKIEVSLKFRAIQYIIST